MKTLSKYIIFINIILIALPHIGNAAKLSVTPRFVSTKSAMINARTGPGVRHPTAWVIVSKGEPLKVTAEFEQWRYVKDIDGEVGWVHSSVLSGARYVIIIGEKDSLRYLRNSDNLESRVVAKLEPNLKCIFKKCLSNLWCKIRCEGYTGWIEKQYLWGVLEND